MKAWSYITVLLRNQPRGPHSQEKEGLSLLSTALQGFLLEPEEKNQTEGFFSFQESKSIVALYFR